MPRLCGLAQMAWLISMLCTVALTIKTQLPVLLTF